jgi:hypothetical protein
MGKWGLLCQLQGGDMKKTMISESFIDSFPDYLLSLASVKKP